MQALHAPGNGSERIKSNGAESLQLELPLLNPAEPVEACRETSELCARATASPYSEYDDTSLAQWLSEELNARVVLRFRAAQRSWLRWRKRGGASVEYRISLHDRLRAAPAAFFVHLVDWMRHPRSKAAAAAVRSYLAKMPPPETKTLPSTPRRLQPKGRCYDLEEIFEHVNSAYFGGAISAEIGWGSVPRKVFRRCIRLGVYQAATNRIYIHPALDHPRVPVYVVEFIVYHEMLHAKIPVQSMEKSRCVIHSKEFREWERKHPFYAQAEKWIRAPENQEFLRRNIRMLRWERRKSHENGL